MFSTSIAIAVLFAADLVAATLYTDVQQLPTNTFDFVIIGAGSAGNIVATRLTEDLNCSVLVIEAGINNEGIVSVAAPFLAPSNVPNSTVSWNYTSTPQAALNGRVLSYPRGRVLGGSSSLNFMTYTRGSNDEYNRWAWLTGDRGWAWENVSQFYLKTSRIVSPTDHHNTTGEFIPAAHGNGPVEVSLPGFPSLIDGRIVDSTKNSNQFPFAVDPQSGDTIGISPTPSTVGGGQRSSSAVAYLQPALNRTNLHVLIENTVTRLIETSHTGGQPAFMKVEFSPSENDKRSTVTARNEVILSAGAIGTPQILMLSGIGNKVDLDRVGIKTLVEIPDVGKHLQDQPILTNYYLVNSNATTDDLTRNKTMFNAGLQQWMETKTGPFVDPPSAGLGFIRLHANSSAFHFSADPSAGFGAGHYELIFNPAFADSDVATQPATGHYVTMYSAVLTPTSVGSVTLASSNPFTHPLINPQFFTTLFDQFAMLDAVKAARQFAASAPWKDLIISPFGTMGAAVTDEEIIAAARESITSIWHPTSSARMSPRGAKHGVVDPDLLVKGIRGLRIVDASIFPAIPACHTVAPTYIVAERASVLIKEAWGLAR